MVSDVQRVRGVRRLLSLSLLGLLGFGWCGALPARAAPYEVEPEAGGELDLLALVEEGAISGETLAALLALRRAGVDPRRATRATLYGLPGLTYADVDALLERGAAVGGLTEEEERRLAPFLARREPGRVSGDARLLMAFAASDALPPPLALQVRAGGVAGARAGVLVLLARRRPGALKRDGRSGALVVDAPGPAVLLPKLHALWTGERASVLAGTYRLGFGQRLTLDTTALPAPEGFLPDDGVRPPGGLERECLVEGEGCEAEDRRSDVTPDFGWEEGFRGLAGTVRGPVGGGADVSLTGFGSYQLRSLPRHAVLDRAACAGATPRGGCKAPDVLVPQAGARPERLTARTLPGAFREWAGGGNVTLSSSARARVGVTGWAARPVWAVEGARLDFQPGARYPAGGGFGAVGLDAAWGQGAVDLFFEGARSFDSAPEGGGGFGALQRTVLSGEQRELELALRYYGRDFANPYSGAPSGPDALEGLRVRNELGVRVRYLQRETRAWRVRGQVDAWTLPADGAVPGTAGTGHLRASARADWLVWPLLQPSLQVEVRDAGLGAEVPCAEDAEDDAQGSCARGRYGVIARVRSELSEGVVVAVQYGHARVVAPEAGGPRYDGQAVLDVRLRPSESLRLGGRVVWKDEDLSERSRLRQELRAAVDASWTAFEALRARARYAWVLDLKDASTARVPPDPPRHLFHLELETRF